MIPTKKSSQTLFLPDKPDGVINWLVQDISLSKSVENAEYLLHPVLLRESNDRKGQLSAISEKYRKYQKQVLVCILSDDESKYPGFNNIFLLRASLTTKSRNVREWTLPYIFESKTDPFVASHESSYPTIGFCGLSNNFRQPLINFFTHSDVVKTDFILREKFWGGNPHDAGLIETFWDNLYANAFTIASRGAGNFSMRFYQALSIGRVPVLLESQMVLPFARQIDWPSYIIMEKTPEACLSKMVALQNSGGLVQRQQDIYNLYHYYFSPANYLTLQCQEISEAAKTPKPWFGWWKR